MAIDYDQHGRTVAPDDFWGQIKRTVNGVPVDESQIEMIVDAILGALALRATDAVLDLACGNGALSRRLYRHCASLQGVDLSEFLISVAKRHFEQPPRFVYLRDDAAQYVLGEEDPERFTKVVCYGSFSYFSARDARAVLEDLRRRYVNVERVFIGNLPDREKAALFFRDGVPDGHLLDDHETSIGIWRSRSQMSELCAELGWNASFSTMPADFYAGHYRYDVLLTPA